MNESYLKIALDRVVLTKNNPRTVNTGSEGFKKLLESVKAMGVVVPVHVRIAPRVGPDDQVFFPYKYELLAGERRYRAAMKAGLTEIKAISHGDITDAEAFEITFAENFQREDLTPVEQGRAAAILLEKYAGDYKATASKLGRSEKWVRQRALIHTQLSDEWKEATAKVEELAYLTTAHLGLIARFPADTQKIIFGHIKGHYQKYSVAELDNKIGDWMRLIAKAPFPNDKCQSCPKRTGAQPGLFSDKAEGDTGKNDKCLDPKCWDKKEIAHKKAAFEEKKKKYPDGLICVAASWMGYGVDTKKLKKIYGKIIDHHGFTKAKKKDTGSVLAYVVYGAGKGKVIYIKVKKTSSGNSAAGKKPTLKELRAGLEQRRWRSAVERFADRAMKIPAAERLSADSMFATALMITVLGCEGRFFRDSEKNKFLAEAIELYKRDKQKANEKIFAMLWEGLAEGMLWNIDTSGDEHSVCQAKLISIYFDIDLDEIYAGVCGEKEFAEPAEWKDLNADGTPKKTVKNRKKKTAKRGK